jgi:hypothetical protein|tara:strand:+ start:52 stop:267 length:216 start_codon:yes stop_codon:yes gene_type:complete
VAKALQDALGKTGFVKVLGKTETEALRSYSRYHEQVEQILRSSMLQKQLAFIKLRIIPFGSTLCTRLPGNG